MLSNIAMKKVNKRDVSVEYEHTYVSERACIIEEYQYIPHLDFYLLLLYFEKNGEDNTGRFADKYFALTFTPR